MASIEIHGTLESVRYLDTSVIVYISEPRNGYKKKDGTVVDPTILTWTCIFSKASGTGISKYFGKGSYVVVKGDVLPYATEKGSVKEGYTVLGHVINHGCYPRNQKQERQMIKDSQLHPIGTPDLNGYNEEDF